MRVEDTDQERSRPELIESILDLLKWLGVSFDEGPYYQSERFELYESAVKELLESGRAYLCDADNNEVQGMQLEDGMAVRFRVSSSVSSSVPNTAASSASSSTASQSSINQDQVSFTDLVRGEVSFALADLEDFVIWRSNQTPTFLLANAVDDADMGITHAIRGEDLLSSTPKVLLLFEALGKKAPTYAHLPLLVNEKRQKLSKRRDDVSLGDWRDRGYMPEAMANYMALLGWGHSDDKEIRPMDEIISLFKLEQVGLSPAFFDVKKLQHFNAAYIRDLPVDEFVHKAEPWLDVKNWHRYDSKVFKKVAPAVQEKIRTFADISNFVDWLFLDKPKMDPDSLEALKSTPHSKEILLAAIKAFEDVHWESKAVHQAAKKVGESFDLSLGKAQMPIRVAITGRKVGPPLFESMVLLDRFEILDRLRSALSAL